MNANIVSSYVYMYIKTPKLPVLPGLVGNNTWGSTGDGASRGYHLKGIFYIDEPIDFKIARIELEDRNHWTMIGIDNVLKPCIGNQVLVHK